MIGIDILDIAEIKTKNLEHFLEKYFTKNEIDYINAKFNKLQTVAGIFCSKEAFLKCFEMGIGAIKLKDIEVLHKQSGAPFINKNQVIEDLLNKNGYSQIYLSISHSKTSATAICMLK